jgi:hypothetical protein
MWARNPENCKQIPRSRGSREGIYILFDGSTPVYIGKGKLYNRIRRHSASKTRGQSWDHFSWYVVSDAEGRHELESLMLRMLPPFLRMLNKQRGKLKGARKVEEIESRPIAIARPHIFGQHRKRRKQ